jgi:hypothetical protein
VYPFPPAPWQPFGAHDRAFVGLDGALLVHIAIRFENADGTRSQVAFAPGLNLGSSAPKNVSALRFWRALQEAERVELGGALFPGGLMQIQPGRLASPAQTRRRLAFLEGICQYVVKLEDLLECSLPVHPPPINEDELLGLEKALTALVDRSTVITVEGTIETSVASAEAALQAQLIRSHPPLMFTLCVTVFGTEIDLGRAVGQMPDVHVIEMPEVTGADRMVTLRVLIAGGRQDIMCRMLDPGEQAPPGAIPI